jgi:hypothetical protein
LSKKIADENVPNESDINIANRHIEFIIEICSTGNQLTTNLLGELSKKQNPNPVIKVPTMKK